MIWAEQIAIELSGLASAGAQAAANVRLRRGGRDFRPARREK